MLGIWAFSSDVVHTSLRCSSTSFFSLFWWPSTCFRVANNTSSCRWFSSFLSGSAQKSTGESRAVSYDCFRGYYQPSQPCTELCKSFHLRCYLLQRRTLTSDTGMEPAPPSVATVYCRVSPHIASVRSPILQDAPPSSPATVVHFRITD